MITTDTRLVAGPPPQRSGFLPRPVHVGFMVDKVVVDEVFSEFFGFLLSISLL
jgi:hypothetical protein